MIASFVTRAASPSLLLMILALCPAPSFSLADARTPCVKPARIHLASPLPTLTQEHSADHRPVAIAAVCAIAAMSVQMRFHVRAIAQVAA